MNELAIIPSTIEHVSFRGKEYLERFIKFADVSPKSIMTYRVCITQFLRWLYRNNINTPTREDILKYKNDLMEKKLKATTQAIYLIAVKRFFSWLSIERLWNNVSEHVKSQKVDKFHKKDYLTAGQSNELLQSIDRTNLIGLRDYALILTMLSCGLRIIEVVRANREDLTISGGCEVLFVQGKGCLDKSQFCKISKETGEAIRDYLKEVKLKESDPLFPSLSSRNYLQRLTTIHAGKIVKKRLRQAGFDSDRLTAHSLRHTAVTLALLSGSNIQEAQFFARHTSINSTQVYAHNLNKMDSKVEQNITNSILHSCP